MKKLSLLMLLVFIVACTSKKSDETSPTIQSNPTTTGGGQNTPTCLTGEYLSSGSCVADTFNATYASTHSLIACDGTQNFTENLTSCIGQNTAVSDDSKCAATSSVQYQSPAGTKDVVVTNGTRHDTCALGSSTVDSFTLDCNVSTYKTASSLLCINPTMAINNVLWSILFDEPNNVIYLAGDFTQYNGVALSGTFNLIKVNATTGERDTNFNVTFTGAAPAHAAVVLDSTKTNLYLGGAFTQVNGTNRTSLAKVSASTGALDTTFDASSETNSWSMNSVFGINEYGSDIYVNGSIDGPNVRGVAKFDSTTGAVNSTFKTNSAAAIVQSAAAYSVKINSGLLYVSGGYTTAGGAPRNSVFSLNSDGTLNSAFDAGLSASAINASGIYGGYLYVAHLSKLKKLSLATGAEDTSFAMPVVTGSTGAILGFGFYGSSFYVGGTFTSIDGLSTRIAKIALSNGAVDRGFEVSTVPGYIRTYFVTGELFLIGGSSSPYFRGYNSSTGAMVW